MKYITLFISITLISCNSNRKTNNDIDKLNLKGKVKHLKSYSYKAIEKFGQVERGLRESSSDEDLFIIFNKFGNKIEKNNFLTNGELDSKYIFEYFPNNLKKNKKSYDKNGKLYEVIKYNYNNNLLLKKISYDKLGQLSYITEYKYNDDNYLIEQKSYNSNGDFSKQEYFNYDKNGNLKEEIFYLNPEKIYRTRNLEYNNINQITREKGKYTDWQYDFTYKYNKKGDVTEQKIFNVDGSIKHIWTYEYSYDSNNNWLSKISFVDNNPRYYIIREITYH